MNILNTGIGIARNVDRYLFGEGALSRLREILLDRRKGSVDSVVFLVDEFFEHSSSIMRLGNSPGLGAEVDFQAISKFRVQ